MRHFFSAGIDIAYRDLGEGGPILLIHAFAANSAGAAMRAAGLQSRRIGLGAQGASVVR